MRLVALALLAAWLVAWMVAPRGAPLQTTSLVPTVAAAGDDTAAVAWLEIAGHAPTWMSLHAVTIDARDRVGDRLQLPAALSDTTEVRLVPAGGGRFVLAIAHDNAARRWFELHRFGAGRHEVLPLITIGASAEEEEHTEWQLAAAGDELVLAAEGPEEMVVYTLGRDNHWAHGTSPHLLVGAGGGHVVRYEDQPGGRALLAVAPDRPAGWTATLGRSECSLRGAPVRAVVGLRGGYARLITRDGVGCVEGLRDGAPFVYDFLLLGAFDRPGLAVSETGTLAVVERTSMMQPPWQRVVLPDQGKRTPRYEVLRVHPALDRKEVRHRRALGVGTLGMSDLALRVDAGVVDLVLERQGAGRTAVLGPKHVYEPDYRRVLRWLGAVPLGCFVLALLGMLRLERRLAGIDPVAELTTLGAHQATLHGTLVTDGDEPSILTSGDGVGGAIRTLRLQAGRALVDVFIEGASIVRASALRPARQPRGDAIDAASGATVVVSGRYLPGELYRSEGQLRAGRKDLVVLGCSITEARALVWRRVGRTAALAAAAAVLVLALVLRG